MDNTHINNAEQLAEHLKQLKSLKQLFDQMGDKKACQAVDELIDMVDITIQDELANYKDVNNLPDYSESPYYKQLTEEYRTLHD